MKVSFELSPSDIRFFRDRLKQVRSSDESVVLDGAANVVQETIMVELVAA
jgi:hypothetical protein